MAGRNLETRLSRLEAKRPGASPVCELIDELSWSQQDAMLLEIRSIIKGEPLTGAALQNEGISREAFDTAIASVSPEWFERLSLAMASVEGQR